MIRNINKSEINKRWGPIHLGCSEPKKMPSKLAYCWCRTFQFALFIGPTLVSRRRSHWRIKEKTDNYPIHKGGKGWGGNMFRPRYYRVHLGECPPAAKFGFGSQSSSCRLWKLISTPIYCQNIGLISRRNMDMADLSLWIIMSPAKLRWWWTASCFEWLKTTAGIQTLE